MHHTLHALHPSIVDTLVGGNGSSNDTCSSTLTQGRAAMPATNPGVTVTAYSLHHR
ncbi:MAG: hypothetical protein ABI465_20940 [Ktedonobacteraceae bacterium]